MTGLLANFHPNICDAWSDCLQESSWDPAAEHMVNNNSEGNMAL